MLYPDLVRAIALARLMLKKWLEPPDTGKMHVSTLIHQTLSCLKQTGGTTAAKIYEALVKIGPFRKVSLTLFKAILHELGKKNIIEQTAEGFLILAPRGEAITSNFDFYAAFQAIDEYFVRNEKEEIGTLPAEHVPPVGDVIILAGRRWLVAEINTETKAVFVKPAKGGKAPDFFCFPADIHSEVVNEMQCVLIGNEEPLWLDNNGRLLLRAARLMFSKCGLMKSNILIHAPHVQWFPWIGTGGLLTLKLFATRAKIRHQTDKLSISYQFESPDDFFEHLKEIIESKVDATELASFLPVKANQKFDQFLSHDLLNIINGNDRLALLDAKTAAREALSSLNK